MDTNNQYPSSPSILSYLSILFKWKKFLLVNMIIILLIATVFAFLIKVQYKATSVVMVPEDNSSGLGSLGSLIGGKSSVISMGAKMFGVGGTSEDVILGLLNSRTLLTSIIQKFNLKNYYEIDDNEDKLLKRFRGDLNFEPNEWGMIEINVIHESPDTAAFMANYFVGLLDSLNIKIKTERASNNRIFIENRYLKNVNDLRAAEDSMYRFQKKYGIFAVPEQLEVAIKATAEIEKELLTKELTAHFTKMQFGSSSPQYVIAVEEAKILRQKVEELKNAAKLSSESNIFFPFKEMPDLTLAYYRYYREIEIQSAIMEVILPMYEQAKVEEQNSIPTITVIDKAVPPTLKDSPKRLFIILGIGFLFFFLLILLVFIGESLIGKEKIESRLEESLGSFFNKIIKLYRIRISG